MDYKAYKLYPPATNKTFVASNVCFDETLYPLQYTKLSHKTYDHALGPLNGVSSYPQSTSDLLDTSDASTSFSHDISFTSTSINNNSRPLASNYPAPSSPTTEPITPISTQNTAPPSPQSTASDISIETYSSSPLSKHPLQVDHQPPRSKSVDVSRTPIQTHSHTAAQPTSSPNILISSPSPSTC